MGYRLRDGLSFCLVAGRAVFLDLPADRYFCLADEAEAAFHELLAGGDAGLEPLVALGVLVESDTRTLLDAAPPLPMNSSLLDDSGARAPMRLLPGAVFRLSSTLASLRWRGFATTVDAVRRRSARLAGGSPEDTAVAELARLHERIALLTASHDKCLWRSLAIAHHLIDLRIAPRLVLGVRLRPFKAHCWVQVGTALVNDRLETVRTFTPILIV